MKQFFWKFLICAVPVRLPPGLPRTPPSVITTAIAAGSSSASISSAARSSSTKSICAKAKRPITSSIRSAQQHARRIAQTPHRSQRSLQHHHPSRRRRRPHRNHPAHRRHLPRQKAEENWEALLAKMKDGVSQTGKLPVPSPVRRGRQAEVGRGKTLELADKFRRSSRKAFGGRSCSARRRPGNGFRKKPANTGPHRQRHQRRRQRPPPRKD